MLRVMTEAGGVARPGGGKHRGGGKRGGRRLAAAAAPLAAAALFLFLLLVSVRSFSSTSAGSGSIEGATFQPAGGGRTAGHAAERAAHDPSPLRSGGDSAGGHRSSWLSAAALWAEENQEQQVRMRQDRYRRDPSGCGLLPCSGQRLRRPPTLVVYAYAATDAEEQRNFEHFLKHGVEEQAGLTYRILIASSQGILPPLAMPRLPPNAEYLEAPACAGSVWGMLAAAAQQLAADLAAAERIVVVSSAVRGPYMPPYTHEFMHWTDAFTSKLGPRTKMVGSTLTCEGAPKGGDAAAEWRQNPYLLPHAWAIDKEGWQLVAQSEEVLQCYSSPWDARYHSDAGAALALLSAGYNIDTLLTKFQGMDWWIQRTWGCNLRVRPDAEWTYDGVSITPYETVFVPFNLGMLQSEWSFVRQAAKYTAWHESQTVGAPQGNANEFVSRQWGLRAQRMVYTNARGPGCFDFEYYVQHNADLADKAGQHQQLWEHFVLLGQFQGRRHRFSCPLQVGNSFRLGYVKARGPRCFDHTYYATNNPDLQEAGLRKGAQLFHHYTEHGQFEQRDVRFACSDLLVGLPAGFDGQTVAPLPTDYYELANEERWKQLVKDAGAQADAGLARLQAREQGAGDGRAAGAAAAAAGGAAQAGLAGGGGQQQQQQGQQQQGQQQAAGGVAGAGRRLNRAAAGQAGSIAAVAGLEVAASAQVQETDPAQQEQQQQQQQRQGARLDARVQQL